MMRMLRRIAELADNLDGRLPEKLGEAGFADVHEEDRLLTPFGPAIFLSGERPVWGA
jgi:hypothetical protein